MGRKIKTKNNSANQKNSKMKFNSNKQNKKFKSKLTQKSNKSLKIVKNKSFLKPKPKSFLTQQALKVSLTKRSLLPNQYSNPKKLVNKQTKLNEHKTDTSASDNRVKNQSKHNIKHSLSTQRIKITKTPKLGQLARKDRKKIRQQLKPNFEVATNTKKIWEELRKKNISNEQKFKLIDKILENIFGKVVSLLLKHDTSRVIQFAFKYGNEVQKSQIFEEISPALIQVMESQYAQHLIPCILRNGTLLQKQKIIESTYGHARHLIKHTEASRILELAYNDYANLEQRNSILQEFYGAKYAHFKEPDKNLDGLLKNYNSENFELNRKQIVQFMMRIISDLTSKLVWRYSLVHKVLRDLLTISNKIEALEIVTMVNDKCIEMLHTRDGTYVTLNCIWIGGAKERKLFLKQIKTLLVKISFEEFGHMTLMGVFDSVDDTVFVAKIFKSLSKIQLKDMCTNKHGRKVILYLIAPRNPAYFHPDIQTILSQGDNISQSKKPREVRYNELQAQLLPIIIELFIEQFGEWSRVNSTSILFTALLQHVTESDLTDFKQVIANSTLQEFDRNHIIHDNSGHLILKQASKRDEFLQSNMVSKEEKTFSEILFKDLTNETIEQWATCNRGCLFLETLFSNSQNIHKKIIQNVIILKKDKLMDEFHSKGLDLLVNRINTII